MRLIDADELIKRINTAEENFKADHMETIGGDIEDPFVDGVLSGVFCIREMVTQAPTIGDQSNNMDKEQNNGWATIEKGW